MAGHVAGYELWHCSNVFFNFIFTFEEMHDFTKYFLSLKSNTISDTSNIIGSAVHMDSKFRKIIFDWFDFYFFLCQLLSITIFHCKNKSMPNYWIFFSILPKIVWFNFDIQNTFNAIHFDIFGRIYWRWFIILVILWSVSLICINVSIFMCK